VTGVSPEALALLCRYPWPGNVRELQSVLKQTLLQAAGLVLLPDFLPASVTAGADSGSISEGLSPETPLDQFIEGRLQAGSQELYAEALKLLERLLLTRVLRHTGGNQLQAAKILGITRGSLRTKIRDLGIRIDRTVRGGDDDEG
jgi:two-component system nitrogen regulation response regulator GlnG